MLVEFSVENYRSISQRQTLSMVAAGSKTMVDSNSFPAAGMGKLRLLKSAALYGANASGKTNILRGLSIVKNIVIKSATQSQVDDKLDVEPFRLNSSLRIKPSNFEIIFIQDEVRYQYYLSLDKERIYEESLFAYPKGIAQCWYTRIYDAESNSYKWKYGAKLKGQKKLIEGFVRPNSLFLSHATQNNHEQLTPIYNWFREKLHAIDINHNWRNISIGYTAKICYDKDEMLDVVLHFMKVADIDIHSLRITKKSWEEAFELNDRNQQDSFIELTQIEDVSQGIYNAREIYSVVTQRQMQDSEELVDFPIRNESQGTQRLFSIIGFCLDALIKKKVVVIDELSRSLHPALSKLIVKIFNQEASYKGGQLIFSTHDSTLLDKDILRRDQVWFTEKNKNRETELYSLVEFKPTKDKSLQQGYLNGRYGAIPFTGKFQF